MAIALSSRAALRIGIVSFVALASTTVATFPAWAQSLGCWTQSQPYFSLAPNSPEWCFAHQSGPGTAVSGTNSWVDEFEHGLSHAGIGPDYKAYDWPQFMVGASLNQTIHWRHNNHWMVDVQGRDADGSEPPYNRGGALVRPDRSFRFENGKLIVEAVLAEDGNAGLNGDSWPEFVITTSPAPANPGRKNESAYAYGQFPFHCKVVVAGGVVRMAPPLAAWTQGRVWLDVAETCALRGWIVAHVDTELKHLREQERARIERGVTQLGLEIE